MDPLASTSPAPFRPLNSRYPDWRSVGMITPPPRYRVWLSILKFHAGNSWDPRAPDKMCRSYLNVWDGLLWHPSNCEGLFWYCILTPLFYINVSIYQRKLSVAAKKNIIQKSSPQTQYPRRSRRPLRAAKTWRCWQDFAGNIFRGVANIFCWPIWPESFRGLAVLLRVIWLRETLWL